MNLMSNDDQAIKCGINEIIASLVLMGILLILSFFLSGLIPGDHIYSITIALIIYLSGIIYLYNRYPTNIIKDIFKPLFPKYTMVGIFIISLFYLNYNNIVPDVYMSLYKNNLVTLIIYLLLSCLAFPVAEEILFRRYYYNILKLKYGVLVGAIISVALFTFVHVGQSINLLSIVLQGMIYTYIYEKSESIWSSIIVHSFSNSMWFFIILM